MTVRPTRVLEARAFGRYEGPLLLDTHIWIWYLEDNRERMPDGVFALLDRAAGGERLLVSDISYWEVALKSAVGRLSLSLEASVWLRRAESAPGIRFLALDRDTLFLSTRLPGAVHNDPADRILLAAAQLNDVPIVTADRVLIRYAASHASARVMDVRS